MTTITATPTELIVAEMLGTSTGASILDSGGADGRHWQRNAGKSVADWQAEPRVTLDPRWGDVTLSVFHHVTERATYCKELDVQFTAYAATQENTYHLQDIESWLELMGGSVEYSVNSYNDESNLSQIIQYTVFTLGGVSGYVALQIHQGADARGGYTAPRIFTLDDECALIAENITLRCTADSEHYLDCGGGGEWIDHNGGYRATPWSLHELAKERGLSEGIACPDEDCEGLLTA